MTKKENSIDQMAKQFTSEEELKAYSEAQYKTIIGLNEKINKLQTDLDTVKAENNRLKQKSAIQESTVPNSSPFKVTDEETICVTQLSILKQNSMERELTMDEVKRAEILVKTLQLIRGKLPDDSKKKDKEIAKLSNEELFKAIEDATNKEPQ